MKRRQHYFGFRAQIYIKTFNCKNISTKASHLFTEIIFHKYVHLFSVQGPCVLVLMQLWSFHICMYISGLSHFSDPFILKSPLVNIRQSLTCPFAEGQIPVITNNCNIIIKQYPWYHISIWNNQNIQKTIQNFNSNIKDIHNSLKLSPISSSFHQNMASTVASRGHIPPWCSHNCVGASRQLVVFCHCCWFGLRHLSPFCTWSTLFVTICI